MPPAPGITSQQTDGAGLPAIEMTNTDRPQPNGQSTGSGLRGWFAGHSERRRSRGESTSSSGSVPKTPAVQEMSRIEQVLTQLPVDPAANEPSGRRSSTQPNSPTPPSLTAGLSNAPSAQGLPTVPSTAESQQAAERSLRAGQLDETRMADPEAQRTQEEAPRRKWWWQQPRWKGAQNRLVTAIIAGIMCTGSLAIYLGLSMSRSIRLQQEWHVLMILVVLVTTLFLCHSLVRLCTDLAKSEATRDRSGAISRVPSIAGPGGYANTRAPIRVNTQSPEEIPGLKEPPPVYGLWRCSVRVNPNEFYWVRRQSAAQQEPVAPSAPTPPAQPGSATAAAASPRPPSYLSDDGIAYVVDAMPEVRSAQPALPPHPSERGGFVYINPPHAQ